MVSAAGRAGVGVREGTVDVTVGVSVRETVVEPERDKLRLRESVALGDSVREPDWPPTIDSSKHMESARALREPPIADTDVDTPLALYLQGSLYS